MLTPEPFDRRRLEKLALAHTKLALREEKAALEGSLLEFFKACWPIIDPAPYQDGWHLEGIAMHLEAVSLGQIRKLCVNICPRHSKTLLCSVAWPIWTWIQEPDPEFPLIGPHVKFMCLAYGDQLALDNAITARRLLESEWFKERWGERVIIAHDQDAKNKFDTTAGGTRISGSMGGTITGRGADIRIIDDPHKLDEVESDVIREGVIKRYDGSIKSRVTDPRHTAEVLVAQRGHMNDLSAHFLKDPTVVHLNLPAEYESSRKCTTSIGWTDPREIDGELLWPQRWGPEQLQPYKSNPYEWASQWQQMPRIRGGAIIHEDWWGIYEVPRSGNYEFGEPLFTLASLDTAFTEKTTNDYSALVVFTVYDDPKTEHRRIMLVDAWKKRLELHGVTVQRNKDETEAEYLRRASKGWGLVEWVEWTCTKRKVNRVIIEQAARGHDVAREIQRLYTGRNFGVQLVPVRGLDKIARVHSIVDLFTDNMIYAPCSIHGNGDVAFRDWARMVIDDMADFPFGEHDDICDAVSMALRYLRDMGLAVRKAEKLFDADEMAKHRPNLKQLYPV